MKITIIGGGITGTTLALALSHLSHGALNISLVEEQTPDSSNDLNNLEPRVIALAQKAYQDLASIGIWPEISPYSTAIQCVQISEKGFLSTVKITAGDYQLAALGYVVQLRAVVNRLLNLLHYTPSVHLYCPAKFIDIQRKKGNNTITLSNGKKLHSQLVVAADGSCSLLAKKCGIRWWRKDYQQVAVVATIHTTSPHRGRAFEKFTPQGSLAILPASNEYRSSIVWSLSDRYKNIIATLDEKKFCLTLQRVFGWQLGRIISVGQRKCYPIQLSKAERHVSHRLALVGNAAQTLHPIAGQGFNLGLRDVMKLAEILVQATKNREDIGSYAVLSHYQRCRKTDQEFTIDITNWLTNIFSDHRWPLVIGRNLGLLTVAHVSYFRDLISHRALGWACS